MTRILCIDAQVSGLAGDMLVGALLDAGADFDKLEADLGLLGVAGYRLGAETVMRGVLRARKFRVDVESTASAPEATASQSHDHGHGHTHTHGHGDEGNDGPDRPWREIRAILERAELLPRVRDRARAVFEALAREEAAIHGVPVDDVSFHEVGGIDAIVDIVGTCLCLEQLGVDEVFVLGTIAVGGGLVRTAHGILPVPAPATVALLRGFAVRTGTYTDGELTTPTGAALLAGLASPAPAPPMRLERVGYGAGTRNPVERPNVVRVIVGRRTVSPSPGEVVVLESNLDDLVGEHVPLLIEALLEAGALDVFVAPVLMKKGRPGFYVQALAEASQADSVARAFLRHGSTFGVRRRNATRDVLDRWHEQVETPWGPIRVKMGALEGEVVQVSPEFEDVKAVARASGRSAGDVHRAAVAGALHSKQPTKKQPAKKQPAKKNDVP